MQQYPVKFKSLEKHNSDLQEIQQKFLQNQNRPFSLSANHHPSHKTYTSAYKQKAEALDISFLNKIISIDDSYAHVEPNVTMDELVHATLEIGMLPIVVPEFKEITVGGAIMGAALESSSYLHGQFNDICFEYEVLLGNGSIATVSPTKNADLFDGLSSSYGTLGIILSAKIKLIKADPWVHLVYHHFSDLETMLKTLSTYCKEGIFDYIESIVFSENHAVIITGKRSSNSSPSSAIRKYSLNAWKPWFYMHAMRNKTEELMPLEDYLFRYDRGAFWMGSYLARWKSLWIYTSHLNPGIWAHAKASGLNDRKQGHITNMNLFPIVQSRELSREPKFQDSGGTCIYLNRIQDEAPLSKKQKRPSPILNRLIPFFLGKVLSSKRLYQILHKIPNQWIKKTFVIQDFYLPLKNALTFIRHVLNKTQVSPIWICPVKAASTTQILAPHAQENETILVDIGVYGAPLQSKNAEIQTKELEHLTQTLGGRKMLYAHSYYTKHNFWKIYSKNDYNNLRSKYQAENRFLNIEDKI